MTISAIIPSAPDPVCPTANPGMMWLASVQTRGCRWMSMARLVLLCAPLCKGVIDLTELTMEYSEICVGLTSLLFFGGEGR